MEDSLSVIIVSHNTRELLATCLTSVREQLSSSDEVVVVDNASSDGSADLVESAFPEVRLIRLSANIGFGRACNVGASASSEHVLLLNPDTRLHSGALAQLRLCLLEDSHAGIYGGVTYTPDGRLDPRSCFGLPTVWSTICFAVGLTSLFPRSRVFDPESLGSWDRTTPREVGMITGCLMLVRRDLWESLTGMDPRFFMYGEDADFNARARRLGARPRHCPAAAITHVYGASTTRPDKLVLTMRGKVTYARLHLGRVAGPICVRLLVFGTLLRGMGSVCARMLRREYPNRDAAWWTTWLRRVEWRQGYPATSQQRMSGN